MIVFNQGQVFTNNLKQYYFEGTLSTFYAIILFIVEFLLLFSKLI